MITMTSPIFSNLERTNEYLTCGIVNIPLTKPAKIFFVADRANEQDIRNIENVFNSFQIPYMKTHSVGSNNIPLVHYKSLQELDSKTIKTIWRNHKHIRPKIETNWRYLFWEIDTKDVETFEYVLATYTDNELPVYAHQTTRGWHFISVKPIEFEKWQSLVSRLRQTNISYPPLTLRIKPNKYLGEVHHFMKGMVISKSYHYDTNNLRELIQTQQFNKLAQDYYTVWYRFGDVA